MSAEVGLHEVLFAIRPLQQHAAKVLAHTATELSLPLRAVLEQLKASGEQAVPQIARSLMLPRQVVQRLADEGNERGMIEFLPNPAHQRSRLLRLSGVGEAALSRVLTQELRLLAPVADALPAEDIEACARVMKTLTTAMHRLAQQTVDELE